jgi:deoxyhypusine synthase
MIKTLNNREREKFIERKEIDREQIARKNILRESEEIEAPDVKGYDFNNGLNYDKLIDSFATTGMQATQLAKAIEIIREMRRKKAFIYLGYTSNMITSGLRDIIRFLVEHKFVDILVTTAGGIEEDIIKCLGNFKIGEFSADGKKLRDKGVNRAGNVFIPNSRYCKFEEFILPVLEKYKDEILIPSQLVHIIGKEINNKNSIYYWAWKNNIPVYCPALTDGSLGDMVYFFKNKNPQFKIDITEDIVNMNNSTIGKNKTGIILLGAGIMKHHICNANMFRNGADYAVYINSQQEFDGSDSGARPDEAVSWGKIAKHAMTIKVYGDATILFPLIVSKTFVD